MISSHLLSSYCYFAVKLYALYNEKGIICLDSISDFHLTCTVFTMDLIREKYVILCNFIASSEVKCFGLVFDISVNYADGLNLFPVVYNAVLYYCRKNKLVLNYVECIRFFSFIFEVDTECLLTYFYRFVVLNEVKVIQRSVMNSDSCNSNSNRIYWQFNSLDHLANLMLFCDVTSMRDGLFNQYFYYHLLFNNFIACH